MVLGFGKSGEDKRVEASEAKAMNFQREQNVLVTDPKEDQLFAERLEDRQELLRWQQDLDKELERLKHDLRNEVFLDNKWEPKIMALNDADGKPIIEVDKKTGEQRYVYARMPPLLNDMGVQMIETEVRPLMSRNLINTVLDEDRILLILKETSNTIVDNLADNHDVYQADFLNFDHIVRLVKNLIIPTLYRAHKGFTKRQDTIMHKHIEAETRVTGQGQRKTFMGFPIK